jgi:hypothetical protein
MADTEKWYLKTEKAPSLHMWVFRNMAMGAVWAALVLFGLIAFILVIRAISFILPEDPFAMLDATGRLITAFA